eukprot:6241478-Pyramimonas_sp.AAC.1
MDEPCRFQKGQVLARETTCEAIKSIEEVWSRHYGTPKTLVMEEYGAACSQEMLDWASQHNIKNIENLKTALAY